MTQLESIRNRSRLGSLCSEVGCSVWRRGLFGFFSFVVSGREVGVCLRLVCELGWDDDAVRSWLRSMELGGEMMCFEQSSLLGFEAYAVGSRIFVLWLWGIELNDGLVCCSLASRIISVSCGAKCLIQISYPRVVVFECNHSFVGLLIMATCVRMRSTHAMSLESSVLLSSSSIFMKLSESAPSLCILLAYFLTFF